MESPSNSNSSYISSTDAAERYGLTNDHIASLCRRKKVEGALAGGRLWFVDEGSLKAYLVKTKQEKEARHRQLSEQIRKEQSVPSTASLWNTKESATSFALALFIVGSFYVSASPIKATLSGVPWEYMPASVAAVSGQFYDETFMAAAVGYLDFVDAVGDVQAQSYLSLGDGVSSAAATSLGVEQRATLAALPAAVAETSVSGWTDMLVWYAQGAIAAVAAAGDISEYFYGTTARAALAVSEGLGESAEKTLTATAQTSIASVYMSGEVSEYFYGAAAQTALSVGEGLAYSTAALLEGFAQTFVQGVYAFGDGQEYVYAALLDTLNDSANTMGASAAGAFRSVDDSAAAVARWYKEGSDRVGEKTRVSQLSGTLVHGAPVASVAEIRTDKLCVGNVCVTEEEFLDMVQKAKAL
jgi:hypothetical protein